ncbi:MAG: hypothetical protein ACRDH9_00420 [Actinomycetota bacterium]
MKRLIVAAAAVFVMLPVNAQAAPDRTLTVEPTESVTWNGAAQTAANLTHFWTTDDAALPEACAKDPQNYCEYTLIAFNNPLTQAEIDAGKTKKSKNATFTLTEFAPIPGPVQDFDQKIYLSDVDGTKGEMVNTPWTTAQPPDSDEIYTTKIETTIAQPIKYYLVEVIYFTTVQGSYKGTVTF